MLNRVLISFLMSFKIEQFELEGRVNFSISIEKNFNLAILPEKQFLTAFFSYHTKKTIIAKKIEKLFYVDIKQFVW